MNKHTLTVIFFQRPVFPDWIILEIPFLISGKSENFGGVNSALAYLTNVFKFGLAVLIIAIYIIIIQIISINKSPFCQSLKE